LQGRASGWWSYGVLRAAWLDAIGYPEHTYVRVDIVDGHQAESSVSKLIMLIAVFATAWWLLKRYLRGLREDAPPPVVPPEDMVCCARCGIHLPRSESVLRDDRHFCGTEHARRDE